MEGVIIYYLKALLRMLLQLKFRVLLITISFHIRFSNKCGHLNSRIKKDIIDEKLKLIEIYRSQKKSRDGARYNKGLRA